jgi:sugar phosphate isomerase/epimerase
MFDLGLAGYNRLAMEEAATLGAPVLVIVSGPPHGQSLGDARATVIDALREVLPDAERAGSRSA